MWNVNCSLRVKKKIINKYMWVRVEGGRVIERALMDYEIQGGGSREG